MHISLLDLANPDWSQAPAVVGVEVTEATESRAKEGEIHIQTTPTGTSHRLVDVPHPISTPDIKTLHATGGITHTPHPDDDHFCKLSTHFILPGRQNAPKRGH